MATIRWCPIFQKWDIYQPLVQLPASSRSIPAPVNAWSVALRKVAEPLSQRGNLSREGGVFPGDLVQDGLAVPLANHWWEKYGKIWKMSHMVPTWFPDGSHMVPTWTPSSLISEFLAFIALAKALAFRELEFPRISVPSLLRGLEWLRVRCLAIPKLMVQQVAKATTQAPYRGQYQQSDPSYSSYKPQSYFCAQGPSASSLCQLLVNFSIKVTLTQNHVTSK